MLLCSDKGLQQAARDATDGRICGRRCRGDTAVWRPFLKLSKRILSIPGAASLAAKPSTVIQSSTPRRSRTASVLDLVEADATAGACSACTFVSANSPTSLGVSGLAGWGGERRRRKNERRSPSTRKGSTPTTSVQAAARNGSARFQPLDKAHADGPRCGCSRAARTPDEPADGTAGRLEIAPDRSYEL